ncbi:MAG: hypothetical protein OEV78_09240 [Spirochaetia bacterium]|nr:hypothetical protein [Spirochaetia bacterium]
MVKTQINTELSENQNTSNVVYLQTAGLSPEIQHELIEYYNQKISNPRDVIQYDDIAKIALYKTIEHGLLSIFLYNVENDSFLFNEGYFHNEIRLLLKNYLHRLNEKNNMETYPVFIKEGLFHMELRLKTSDSKKYIFGVIAQEMQIQTDAINQLEKFFSRYYFTDLDLYSTIHEYNYLPELNNVLRITASRAKKNNHQLFYSLIEIEPLKKYIKIAGDYMVNEIIENVREEINLLIKDFGHCFILNSRQYLITVVNRDEKFLKEKFSHAHFRIKNLLLVYQMNYYEVIDLDNGYSIENAWPNLKKK